MFRMSSHSLEERDQLDPRDSKPLLALDSIPLILPLSLRATLSSAVEGRPTLLLILFQTLDAPGDIEGLKLFAERCIGGDSDTITFVPTSVRSVLCSAIEERRPLELAIGIGSAPRGFWVITGEPEYEDGADMVIGDEP